MPNNEILLRIVNHPATSDAERAEARRELGFLESQSATTKEEEIATFRCGPLGPSLLKFSGAREMRGVSWRELVSFTESHEWPGGWQNPEIKSLWLGWMVWGSSGILFGSVGYDIWADIKKEFATDQERRAEFERLGRQYPLFELTVGDDPYELESYERNLDCTDRKLILAITQKKLEQAPEYYFRTRDVAQRVIDKLQAKEMQNQMTNDELYRRMNDFKTKFTHSDRQAQASAFQTTPLYTEVRRRAGVDREFESLIPLELMPLFFPERFAEAS